MSLSAALNSTCFLSTNSIGLIAELGADVSQAQHAGTKTMNHIPTSSNRKLLEDTTIRLGVWNHVCTARDPTRKWLASISTSLLASRLLLLLTSGLLVLLLLLLSGLLLLTGLTLGKIGLGLLFPTPPLPTSLTSLTAHLPSPNSI